MSWDRDIFLVSPSIISLVNSRAHSLKVLKKIEKSIKVRVPNALVRKSASKSALREHSSERSSRSTCPEALVPPRSVHTWHAYLLDTSPRHAHTSQVCMHPRHVHLLDTHALTFWCTCPGVHAFEACAPRSMACTPRSAAQAHPRQAPMSALLGRRTKLTLPVMNIAMIV